MELLEGLLSRRSTKSYLDTMVEEEKLTKIIEAGLCAPSGMNRQWGRILVVTGEKKDALAKFNASVMGASMDPFYGAPVVLLVVVKKCMTAVEDGSLMMENMLLASHALGLGACWIHRAKEELENEDCIKMLDAPFDLHEYIGVGQVIVGYPKDTTKKDKPILKDRVYFL